MVGGVFVKIAVAVLLAPLAIAWGAVDTLIRRLRRHSAARSIGDWPGPTWLVAFLVAVGVWAAGPLSAVLWCVVVLLSRWDRLDGDR